MTLIICPQCKSKGKHAAHNIDCTDGIEVRGIIKCLQCFHERPFVMRGPYIQEIGISMPGEQSDKLDSKVPSKFHEDIKEAERAHFAQCYRASAAMCRRGIQLALIDKGIPDQALGKMIENAKHLFKDENTYNVTRSIKGYGDIAVHRNEKIEEKDAEIMIYAAVRVLNELFS